MNIVDALILIIFAFFMLRGWYEGFLRSVLGVASFFLSWLGAAVFSPLVSNAIHSQSVIADTMLNYTEGSELISDVALARLDVTTLTHDQLSSIVQSSSLPSPIGKLIEQNIATEAFSSKNIFTVGDYYNTTIVCFIINVISFLIVFAIISVVLMLVIHWYDYSFNLPVLRHFDGAIGAGFGLIRAFFTAFVLFMALPPILVVLSGSFPISQYISSSFFGDFFYKSNFLLNLIGGT